MSVEESSLVRSSSVMAVGTIVSRVTGLLRDVALVAAIGLAVLGDAYQVANSLPNILYILLVGGALNSVFIPQLVRRMSDDPDKGTAYAQRLLTLVALVLLTLTALAVALAPLVIDLYATDEWGHRTTEVAVAFARYCLPQIVFYGLFTMFQQVLNARGVFGPPMFAPIVNNLVVIATCGLFILVAADDRPLTDMTITDGEVALLGLGTTLGITAQALCLVPAMRRAGFRWRPQFDFRGTGLRKAGHLAQWTFVYVLINQIGYAVIVNLATKSGARAQAEGLAFGAGIATYSKAYLIFLLPHAVITVSVVTALFPRMSRDAADGHLDNLRRSLADGLRLIGVAIVPAAILFLALGAWIGVMLFGLGAAGIESGRHVGLTLQAFALGLVPFCLFYAFNRGFYALEDTRTPALINVVVNAVNVSAAYALFLAVPPRWTIPSLAVALGLSYLVGTLISALILRRRLGGLEASQLARSYLKLTAASAGGGLLAWFVGTRLVALFGDGYLGATLAVALGLLAGGGGFVALALAMRVDELSTALAAIRQRLRPRSEVPR
jgi:putative peptidoglycan lipid II flippase